MPDIDDRWHRRDEDGNLIRTTRYGIGSRWLVRWRDEKNKQRKKSFKRKVEAEDFAARLEHDLRSGAYIAPDAGLIPLGLWANKWLPSRVHLSPSTAARYASIVNAHILPRWSHLNLSAISHVEVQEWISGLSKELSPRTVAKVHRVFSLMMKWAVDDRRIGRNPADGVRLPRPSIHNHRYLTHGQVARLATACGMRGNVVRFLAYTGLRWGEMAALRCGQVDLARRRILVTASVTEVNGRLVWGNPKNHQRRSVPMPRFVADEVAELIHGRADDELVFTAPQGGVLRVRNFRRDVFASAVREIDLAGFHPHELRHTAASLAIASGADVKLVQRMLGHQTATLTLDLYGHLFADNLNDVADRMHKMACAPDVPHEAEEAGPNEP